MWIGYGFTKPKKDWPLIIANTAEIIIILLLFILLHFSDIIFCIFISKNVFIIVFFGINSVTQRESIHFPLCFFKKSFAEKKIFFLPLVKQKLTIKVQRLIITKTWKSF